MKIITLGSRQSYATCHLFLSESVKTLHTKKPLYQKMTQKQKQKVDLKEMLTSPPL